MPTRSITNTVSNFTSTTEKHKPKLWIVAVGINKYQDPEISNLNCCTNDALSLADALKKVALHKKTDRESIFERVETTLIGDFDSNSASSFDSVLEPTTANILTSLEAQSKARSQDTILFYFSGHGFYDSSTKETILSVYTTKKDALSTTGLAISQAIEIIMKSPAKQQLIWLDACHSGGVDLISAIAAATKKSSYEPNIYVIASCKSDEKSLELPHLEHGLFTHNLIQGLQGGIARSVITVPDLYEYVSKKTPNDVDRQNRLLKCLKRSDRLDPFTPVQCVFGSGEFELGLYSALPNEAKHRGALIIDGSKPSPTVIKLSNELANKGKFLYQPYTNPDKSTEAIKESIAALLRSPDTLVTLLYLQGRFESIDKEEFFVFDDGTKILKDWLTKEIANSPCQQQVIIFDCSQVANIEEQIEPFQQSDRSQCIVAASTEDKWLGEKLIEIIDNADSTKGLTAADLIYEFSYALGDRGISLPKQRKFHRFAPQEKIIDIIFPQQEQTDNIVVIDRNYCPYKGLEVFTPQDKDYFFGRDKLRDEIINKLKTTSFLLVMGASGSGKSSVVQAGVVPQLQDNCDRPCRVWIMRPGDDPFRALTSALSNEKHTPEDLKDTSNNGIERFVNWLDRQPLKMSVLVIDQFEELFTQASEVDRSLFLELIVGAVQKAGDRLKVVITLRSDFINPCMAIPLLGENIKDNSILVPSYLTKPEYQQIITEPAKRVGLLIKPELVNVLVDEVAQAKNSSLLPLLELTLRQLWVNRDCGSLSLQTYQDKIGSIKQVLQEKADKVYQGLNEQQQKCAERIFIELVNIQDGQEDTKRRIKVSNLKETLHDNYSENLDSTLNILSNSRLIVINDEQTQTEKSESLATIEIAHEVLIHNWQQLRSWLNERRDRIRPIRQIEEKAQEWHDNKEQSDYLIQGNALTKAEEIYIFNEFTPNCNKFIYQSIEQRDRQTKLAKRRRNWLIGSLTGGIVIISAIAVFASLQSKRAFISEINAINDSSQVLLKSNQEFDALIKGLRAGRAIQKKQFVVDKKTRIETLGNLQNVFYEVNEFNRLKASTYGFNYLAWDRDGKTLASASRDGTVKLWNTSGKLLKTLEGHTERVNYLVWDWDGQTLASASRDGTVKLWNTSGKLVNTLKGHTEPVSHVAWSRDGQTLASASDDGTVKLWNTSGKLLNTLKGHTDAVIQIAWSQDGKTLASISYDGKVKLWSASGELLNSFHNFFVNGFMDVSLSFNGKIAAFSGGKLSDGNEKTRTIDSKTVTINDKTILLVDFKEKKLLHSLKGHTSRIFHIAWSQDGQTLVSASDDGAVKLWNTSGELLDSLEGHAVRGSNLAFSQDNGILSYADNNGTIKMSTTSRKLLGSLEGHTEPVNHVAWSQDGKILTSASMDGTVKLWNTSGKLLKTLKGHTGDVNHIAWSEDGKTLASASDDGTVRLWNNSGELLSLEGHTKRIHHVAWGQEGKILASASQDGTVRLWNTSGKSLALLEDHNDNVNYVAWSHDGKTLASASANGTIKLWDTSGTLLNTLEGHTDPVIQVAWNQNGKILASASYDGTIKLWDTSGTLLNTLKGHKDLVSRVAWNQNGKILASASQDGTVNLWNTSGKLLNTLENHNDYVDTVNDVAWGKDSEILAVASEDGTVKLWDTSGELLHSLEGHTHGVFHIAWSQDGKTLASGSRDGTIKLWSLELDKVMEKGCDWVQDYLNNNPNVSKEDREICNP